jgi:predicted dehydrogenase
MKKIGLVGCGAISGIYLQNITKVFKGVEFAGACDLIGERADKAVEEYGLPRKYNDMHELFSDPDVDIVLNLTRPYEHFDVTMAAMKAGKHVYTEKSLGATWEEGEELVAFAKEKRLLICGAPDTFLGAGIQTCRKLIDDGFIGAPLGASAFFTCRGHERWHPDPEFYYKRGGGPMLDMGPYYVTALVSLLGPVSEVSGMSKITFPTRTITSEPHYGINIDVDVPTHVTGMMRFESGVMGTIFTSFDVHAAQMPRIEIYGSEGTLSVPDPNTFGGPVMLYRASKKEFLEVPLLFDYPANSRGLGVADMAAALENGRDPRCSLPLIHHAIEILTGYQRSSDSGRNVKIKTRADRPAPMKAGLIGGVLD